MTPEPALEAERGAEEVLADLCRHVSNWTQGEVDPANLRRSLDALGLTVVPVAATPLSEGEVLVNGKRWQLERALVLDNGTDVTAYKLFGLVPSPPPGGKENPG